MFCSKCGKEIMDEAVICPNCGCPTNNYTQSKQETKVGHSDDYVIIKEYAEKAKRAKILGVIAVVLSLGIGLIFTIIGMVITPNHPPVVTTTLPHEIAEFNKAKSDIKTASVLYSLQIMFLCLGVAAILFFSFV